MREGCCSCIAGNCLDFCGVSSVCLLGNDILRSHIIEDTFGQVFMSLKQEVISLFFFFLTASQSVL